jgi:hypothetical protein
VVQRRLLLGYQFSADIFWKRHVCQLVPVHVPHLPSVDAEFQSAKAVIMHRHAGPAEQLTLDHFACWFHADIIQSVILKYGSNI